MKNKKLTIKSIVDNVRTGRHFRELRTAKGFKMKWVATQIGVSEAMISLLERGQRVWSADRKAAYLKAIGEA